jgi:hypothetical protein
LFGGQRAGYDFASEASSLARIAIRGVREDPQRKEALIVTIVWILIVIILVLLVIGLARRVL